MAKSLPRVFFFCFCGLEEVAQFETRVRARQHLLRYILYQCDNMVCAPRLVVKTGEGCQPVARKIYIVILQFIAVTFCRDLAKGTREA